MRIAMYMPNLAPGALGWKVHLDFARAVRERGHEFELWTTDPERDAGRDRTRGADGDAPGGGPAAADGPTGDGPAKASQRSESGGQATGPRASEEGGRPAAADEVRALPVPGRWRGVGRWAAPLLRSPWLPGAAAALRDHLRTRPPIDLLHLEVAYPHGAAALLGAAAAGWSGPVVLTPMGEDVLLVRDASYGFRRHLVPRALVRWTLRRATCIRSLSPLFDDHIAAIAPEACRRVVPLNVSDEAEAAARRPVEEARERRRRARAAVDAEHGTAGRPLVLSFGRLHPFKGIDVLVDAMVDLPEAVLLVVGPSLDVRPRGDVATSLVERARRHGIADRVLVPGPVPHERALDTLAAADVVAVPSHLESLNKVCMEAAAVGTPFVVTETTGISAWVPDDGVGLVVPPRNRAALAWALAEVLEGHFAASHEAQRRFALTFAPRRIADHMVELYEECRARRR